MKKFKIMALMAATVLFMGASTLSASSCGAAHKEAKKEVPASKCGGEKKEMPKVSGKCGGEKKEMPKTSGKCGGEKKEMPKASGKCN